MKNGFKLMLGILVTGLFAFQPVSFADWSVGIGVGDGGYHDHGYYHWHDHPHWGYHAHYLPPDAYVIWVGGQRYYYSDGLYYEYVGGGDYIIVNPPMGAYVTAIPPDFQQMVINGRVYYTSDGIYYVWTHHGYKVVAAPGIYETPVVVQQPAPVVYTQPATTVVEAPPAPVQDSFTINVPNNGGSYTPVVIRRSGNGYTGPQGEFYASFPSVAQLKAMYSK